MSDLVIGSRRAVSSRLVRNSAIAVLIVAVVVGASYIIYSRLVSYEQPSSHSIAALSMTAGDKRWLSHDSATLNHVGEIRVLRLMGSPYELGASHGRLLGPSVDATHRSLYPALSERIRSDGWFARRTFSMRLRWRYRSLDDGIADYHRQEVAGLSRGAGRLYRSPGYEELLRAQTLLDIGHSVPWSEQRPLATVSRSLSFVATLRGTSGDRLLVGRSFALPGVADGGLAAASTPVVTIARPSAPNLQPYVSVGWPGLVGIVSGVNAEGLGIFVHPIRLQDIRASRLAKPIALLARDVLERAETLKEAIQMLERAPTLGAAAFLIVDGAARTWAVVERSPTQVAVVRQPPRPVVTEILGSDAFADDPENDRTRRHGPQAARANRAARLLAKGAAKTPEDVVAILRDHRDVQGGVLSPGHRAALNDVSAAHTAVFDASALVLWVSDGPGASGTFRSFDLRHELRAEGARPAPPPDIAAVVDRAQSRPGPVLSARRHLVRARRAAHVGDSKRADEHALRALTRAPYLPEALRFAAALARANGNEQRARVLYQQYLDSRPTDRDVAEAIRTYLKE